MTKMKTVVLPNGFEFDVQANKHWLAMDESGVWNTHQSEFEPSRVVGYWSSGSFAYRVNGLKGPFEPGDWTEQLYWIGE